MCIELINEKISSISPLTTKELNEIRKWNIARKELQKYIQERQKQFRHLSEN